MRLICPNCDAQYEVDDAAIPVAGRDVQCSNCGHAWFQLPPEVEAERAAEAALHDAPEDAARAEGEEAVLAAIMAEDIPERTVIAPLADAPPLPPMAAAATVAQPMEDTTAVQRRIDESVLAVLREEAEREMIARRLDAQALETQGDLGLDAASAPIRRQDQAAVHSPAPAAMTAPEPVAEPEEFAAPRMRREPTRREMLPDIEEINSSLRPGDKAIDAQGMEYEIARRPEPGRSSFRSGFVLMLVIGLLGLLGYVMAPQISAQIPAAKPALDSYVQTVDAGRLWLDGAARGLVSSLRGLAGNETP